MTALTAPVLLFSVAGAAAASTTLTGTLTSSGTVSTGDTILVSAACESTADFTGVTDSAGNTYVSGVNGGLLTSGTRQRIFRCFNATALGVGGTITATCSSAAPAKGLIAVDIANVTGLDQEPVGVTGTSIAPAGNTGALANNNEIVFAQTMALAGNTDTFTDDFNFTTIAAQPVGAGQTWLSWFTTNSLSPVYYQANLGVSDTWGLKLIALEGAALPAPFTVQVGTLGGSASRPPPAVIKTRYGYTNTISNPLTVTTCGLLGSDLARYSIQVQVPNDGASAAALYANAGIGCAIIMSNRPSGGPQAAQPPIGLPAINTFISQVSASLAVNKPYCTVIENEENAGLFFATQCADVNNPYIFNAISSMTWSGSVVTVVATNPHNLPIGISRTAVIQGVVPGAYNGTLITITPTNATTFTYPVASNPGTVTVQGTFNAADTSTFPATAIATANAYINELSAAVRAAHAGGYKITNGGTTDVGVYLAYWLYLYNLGLQAQADAFANVCLSTSTLINHELTNDLPTLQFPNRPILANHPQSLLNMYTTNQLLPLYALSGADYWNFHPYAGVPDTQQAIYSFKWAQGVVGLPLVSDEFGVRSTNTLVMTGLATIAQLFNMQYMIAFDGQPGNRALPLADPGTGALNSLGTAYKNVITTYGGP